MLKIRGYSSYIGAFLVLLFYSSSLASPFSSNLHGFTTSLGNFSGAKINPSSIKLKVGSTDVTSTTEIKPSSSIYDGFDFTVNLKEPLKAQVGLEVRLEGKTLDGKVIESKTTLGVIPRIQAPNIIPIIVPDDIPLSKATPYTVEGSRGLLVVARASDAINGYINTFVPVKALSTTGQVQTSFSSDNAISFRASASNGSAKFVNGIALVPTRIKLDNAGNSTTLGHVFMLPSSNQGSSLRVQAVPNASDDCGDAPVSGAVPVALDAPKTILDTIANAPIIGGLLDWMNGVKTLEFEVLGGKFTGGDLATLIWGVIPVVGDATVLADNAYRWLTGQGVNGFEAALAAVGLGLDLVGNEVVGAAVSGILAIFKISRSGKGILANALEAAFDACIVAGGGGASSGAFIRPLGIPDPAKAIKCAEEVTEANWADFIDVFSEGAIGIARLDDRLDFWKQGKAFQATIRGQNLSPEAIDALIRTWQKAYKNAAKLSNEPFLSPGGLYFDEGQVAHVFEHLLRREPFFAQGLSKEDVLSLVDDAYAQIKNQINPNLPKNKFVVPIRPPAIGRNGETSLCLILGTSISGEFINRVVSAYPFGASGCS
jgi:hypothetical protein